MGLLGLVTLLFPAGADVNLINDCGRTALHHATMGGEYEIINQVIQAGVNMDVQDHDGYTALHKVFFNCDLNSTTIPSSWSRCEFEI